MSGIRFWCGAIAFTLCMGSANTNADPLNAGFQNPPASARPRVWWHWMNGNITEQGIDLDLAWMKRVGIGGFQNFDISLSTPQIVEKRLAYMTPEWKSVFRHTVERADQLNLEMAIASSPGWSESGGPWVKPEQAMKKLVWSETKVTGGRPFNGSLPQPPTATGPFQTFSTFINAMTAHNGSLPLPSFYADAAIIAYRVHDEPKDVPTPKITTSTGAIDAAALIDGDLTTSVKLPITVSRLGWLQFDYGLAQTMRSARIATGAVGLVGSGLTAKLMASDDGLVFRPVANIPMEQAPQQTTSFQPVTARYFRLEFGKAPLNMDFFDAAAPGFDIAAMSSIIPPGTGTPTGFDVAEFTLSPEARINQFELKAGFGVVKDYYALETANRAEIAGTAPSDVVDLTGKMSAEGHLTWTPPPGNWRILRLGYSLVGTENHPATMEATGLEVDKLNRSYAKAYIDTYLDHYAEILGPKLMGKHGVTAMLNDSTEVGPQNWTDDILQQFQTRRGYDPRPWLPTLTGAVIGDGVKSDAFLYDFRKTLAELTAETHYAVMAEAAHAHGLINYGEALEDGRPSLGDDMDMRRYASIPMSAMWTYKAGKGPRQTYVADVRGAASVAHLYGQNLVAAESMTAALAPWAFMPRDLKPVIDLEFALGVNRPVVHTSVHQPLIDKKPGLSLGLFGQYFNRNDTWAEQAKPWVDYMARNAFMLQQGRFFADVAYFFGEEAPLTGLYASQDTPDLPHGYAFDFVNATALNRILTVENGFLVAPSGARFRLLFLGGSSTRMTLATLRRIHDLVVAGAIVAGPRPHSSPSLIDDPTLFDQLADSLWKKGETISAVGLGKIIATTDPDEALSKLSLARDFDPGATQPEPQILFVHRKLVDGDLYFIDNRKDRAEHLDASFRVAGKMPELWHAETGSSDPVSYRSDGTRTIVPIDLDANEAVFVVFRKTTGARAATVAHPVETPLVKLADPWQVNFEAGRGAPASMRFDHLTSWTDNPAPGVKYFSGTATYTHDLTLSTDQLGSGNRIEIDLGDVRDLAEVRVNGTLVGTPWHAPYRADLTPGLKPGVNRLAIKITSTWANRLIGDLQPGADRFTFTVIPTYRPNAPLHPSGLLGPVQVVRIASGR